MPPTSRSSSEPRKAEASPGAGSVPRGTVPRGTLGQQALGEMLLAKTGDADTSNRVIRLDRAIRCCDLAVDKALNLVSQIGVSLLDGGDGFDLALVPGLLPAPGTGIDIPGTLRDPRIIRITPGNIVPGAVLIYTANMIRDIEASIGTKYFAQALLDGISTVSTAVKTQVGGCSDCMMKQALRQKPNKRRTKRSMRSRR